MLWQRRESLLRIFFPWLFLFTAACESAPTADSISLGFGSGGYSPPIEVDTVIDEGQSLDLPEIEVEVTYAAPATATTTEVPTVTFLQYRVDYDLGLESEVPFYASVMSVTVEQGSTGTALLRAVGIEQLEWMGDRFAGAPVGGIATLTLAGYDHRDEVVLVETRFDIAFANY